MVRQLMKVYILDPLHYKNIFDILVRFRSYKYAQSAFLNIQVVEEDRDFLRFLRVKDIDQKDF